MNSHLLILRMRPRSSREKQQRRPFRPSPYGRGSKRALGDSKEHTPVEQPLLKHSVRRRRLGDTSTIEERHPHPSAIHSQTKTPPCQLTGGLRLGKASELDAGSGAIGRRTHRRTTSTVQTKIGQTRYTHVGESERAGLLHSIIVLSARGALPANKEPQPGSLAARGNDTDGKRKSLLATAPANHWAGEGGGDDLPRRYLPLALPSPWTRTRRGVAEMTSTVPREELQASGEAPRPTQDG